MVFGYDTRGRLTSEVRSGQNTYDFEYRYDQGGNRTLKTQTIDANSSIEVSLPSAVSKPRSCCRGATPHGVSGRHPSSAADAKPLLTRTEEGGR